LQPEERRIPVAKYPKEKIEIVMNKPTPAQWEKLILLLVIMLGAWLRFMPTVLAGDVINDGGMFYMIAQDLQEQNYLLPQRIAYNHLEIPFAYPPLPFYLTALLSDFFHLPLRELFRWLPAIFSTLSVLAFYPLSRTILKSSAQAVLATAAFALMPRSFSWFVMGGGVSRALGQLFFLLTVLYVYKLFAEKDDKNIIPAALFGALVALSHPGQFLHTAAAGVFIWLFYGRKDLLRAVWVASGVALLTSVWWGTVIFRHGWEAFFNASQTGGLSTLFWLPLLTPSFAEEQFITLFTVMGIIGLAACLARRELFLPLWVLFPFAVDPRSASSIVIIPLSMLAGLGLNDIVFPAIVSIKQKIASSALKVHAADWSEVFSSSLGVRILVGYLLIVGLIGAYSYDRLLMQYTVSDSNREAMDWVLANTPAGSRFLLLTGVHDPFADPVQEWFPALTGRVSVTTIQGKEWLLGAHFLSFRDSVRDLQRCLNADPACVEQGAAKVGLTYDYLYVLKTPVIGGESAPGIPALLAHLLRQSAAYELVYEGSDVVIFARAPAAP